MPPVDLHVRRDLDPTVRRPARGGKQSKSVNYELVNPDTVIGTYAHRGGSHHKFFPTSLQGALFGKPWKQGLDRVGLQSHRRSVAFVLSVILCAGPPSER